MFYYTLIWCPSGLSSGRTSLRLQQPPVASVQSCKRSATATGLDHKSQGVREACTMEPANRCLVMRACCTRLGNCRLLCGPGFGSMSPEASSLISNHRGYAQGWHTQNNYIRLPDASRICCWRLAPLSISGICGRSRASMSSWGWNDLNAPEASCRRWRIQRFNGAHAPDLGYI